MLHCYTTADCEYLDNNLFLESPCWVHAQYRSRIRHDRVPSLNQSSHRYAHELVRVEQGLKCSIIKGDCELLVDRMVVNEMRRPGCGHRFFLCLNISFLVVLNGWKMQLIQHHPYSMADRIPTLNTSPIIIIVLDGTNRARIFYFKNHRTSTKSK